MNELVAFGQLVSMCPTREQLIQDMSNLLTEMTLLSLLVNTEKSSLTQKHKMLAIPSPQHMANINVLAR